MSKFVDKAGREWHLNINIAAMRRAKSKDIDLSMAVSQLKDFILDDVFLVDALYAICKPELDTMGITLEQFELAFDGVATEKAREALWTALGEYYDVGKSQLLLAAIASVKAEIAKATSDILIGSPASKAN